MLLNFDKNRIYSYFVRCICGISSCFTVFGCFSYSVPSSAASPCSAYSLPLGKDILLSSRRRVFNNLICQSSNPSVVSINSYGIAHANSVGKAKVSIFNPQNHSTATYTVNVIEAEPVKCVYSNINPQSSNLNVTIKALTPKSATAVKIEITKQNYKNVLQIYNKSANQEWCSWSTNISLPEPGIYNVKAVSCINGQWKECKNSYSYFYVDDKNKHAETSGNGKNISHKGIHFISQREGFVPHVYKDVVNVLTIGYGKVIPSYEAFYNNITKEEALADMVNTLNNSGFVAAVNDLLVKNNIQFNQHQFDALVSFTYNLGKMWIYGNSNLKNIILNIKGGENNYGIVNSENGLFVRQHPNSQSNKLTALPDKTRVTVLNPEKENGSWYHIKTNSGVTGYCYGDFLKVNRGQACLKDLRFIDRESFIREFLKYHHAQGKCLKGLLARRLMELEIFFHGNYTGRPNYHKYALPPCIRGKI